MKGLIIIILIITGTLYYFSFVRATEITDINDIRMSIMPNKTIHFELTDSKYFLKNTDFHFSEKKDTLFVNFQKSSYFNIFCTDKKTDATISIESSTRIIQYCSTNISIDESNKINTASSGSINYKGKVLFFVQSLYDEQNIEQGKVYIEHIPHEDSIFKSLFIFKDEKLVYFVGDGILTNFIDSTNSIKNYYGYRFSAKDQHYIEFSIVNDHELDVSDLWRITYNTKDQRFEAPYDDFQ